MKKREFLKGAASLAVSAAMRGRLRAARKGFSTTYTYKTVHGCAIQADVYRSALSGRKPVLVWIHGGALIFGSRRDPPEWLNPEGQYELVSIDYRLAPETKLPEIIEDLRDAYMWLVEEGPGLFPMDPERICMSGESAGGYLTLMSGFCVSPRPRVLLSLSGYGDITQPWYTRPSAFYEKMAGVTEAEARSAVGGICVTGSDGDDDPRFKFYLYCRQHGTWPEEVTGHDPATDRKWFDPYCPIRNVTAEYPATVLIHGSGDTDVPYEESVHMDVRLAQAGIKHEFLHVPGGRHCLEGDAPAVRASVFEQAREFVRRHL